MTDKTYQTFYNIL